MSQKAAPQITLKRTLEQHRAFTTPGRPAAFQAHSSPLLTLQQNAGNQAMSELLESGAIQAKLRVSQPGDPDELEADHIAQRIVSSPVSPRATLHRKCSCSSGGATCAECEEEQVEQAKGIHRKSSGSWNDREMLPDSFLRGTGQGRPLDAGVREGMEAHLGMDLSPVRVHDDPEAAQSARSINAQAYTAGGHIYFSSGSYAPQSADGQRLLAHELVHVVQQSGGSAARVTATNVAPHTMESKPSLAAQSISSHPAGIQRSALADLGNTAVECAKATKRSVISLVSFNFTSIADLLGIPKPEGEDPSVLDTVMVILKHPCLQLAPGYGLLQGVISQIESIRNFLKGAWKVVKNPSVLLDPIKQAISDMIAKVPDKARQLVDQAAAKVGAKLKKILEGIWRHLEPKLNYLATNWWDVVKESAWGLIWPWPGVFKELPEIWGHIKTGTDSLWNLRFSQAVDELLAVWRGANSVAGQLSGWFTIAAVLIGAILGGIFGFGAGAIPGALAGFEVAAAVGEGILLSTVAAETATIEKAAFDLLLTNQTEAQIEDDYEKISASGLTLAITGIMVLLGSIATKFAKGLFNRVTGLFKKPPTVEPPKIQAPKVEPPKVQVPKTEAPKIEAPKTKTPKVETPKTEAPKVEAPETEAPKTETPKTETPETPKVEAPKAETPSSEAPKTEAPKVETPKTEAPKTETPKTETPETPKVEAPKAETPTSEAPKTEAPKSEAPKTETPDQPKEPSKSSEKSESKADEGEKPEKSGKKSPKEDAQAGVKKRLETLKKQAAEIQENLDRLSKEIREANRKIEALKKETSASTGDARAKASAELKAARENLAELNDEYKAWTEDKAANAKNQEQMLDALKAGTYDRPSFRKEVRDTVWESAKGEGGIVRDPLTKQEIKPGDPWEMGHKPGYEFWKHQQSAAERGISREQFINEYNEPKLYRPETPETNASHKLEAPDHVYYGK
jgi:archaellum component FlaC